jgi:peptidoglycan/LPS O-acetylase OafA/YrhL
MLFPQKPGGMSGGVELVIAMFCGLLGACVGLYRAWRWVSHRSLQPWKSATWLGIAAGMVIGLAVCFGMPHFLGGMFQEWWGTIILLAASGMLGGMASTGIDSLQRSELRIPARKKKRKSTKQRSE